MIPEYSIKQIAEMKKQFINSDFGKYAAQKITEIHGRHHEDAENAATMEQQAAYVNKASGVSDVIRFFTADVALLDQGYFEEKKEKKPKDA